MSEGQKDYWQNYQVLNLDAWIKQFNQDEINVDKLQEYLDFIQEAVSRYDESRYSEWHHIMPKCVDKEGKYSSEGVQINGRDHFLAHRVLVECFNKDKKRRLSFAVVKMLGHISKEITPDEYEEVRRLNSEALKGNQRAKGYKHTEESRRVMSEKHRDRDTEETRYKRSQSLLGHTVSQETRSKISTSLQGRPFPGPSYDWSGKRHSEETKKKISEAVSGERNGMYGKTHTDAVKRQMSISRQGNQNAKGNIWITDGINNTIVRDLKDIPDGWRRGRTIKRKKVI